jgi:TolA-binding protein
MIAAATLLVGAASFGAINLGRPIAVLLGLVSTQPTEPEPAPRHAPPPAERVAPPIEEVVEAPAPEPAPPVVDAVPAPRGAIHRPLPAPSAPPSPPAPAITAAELFKTATAARSEGRLVDAEQTYRTLTRQFPDSPEASVTHAVLGRLLLDVSRPPEALEELDAALAGAPFALREDTLANRALALEALKRKEDALRAWQTLLWEFPRSPHATRARGRVEALSGP